MPMKILAVDSSTAKASVALYEQGNQSGKVLGVININDGKTHSEKLVPMIAEVISEARITPQDIDFYAVSAGPGSFTGLRIGVTTVKAIAMAVGKPCVAVPTLDALANNCTDHSGIICPMINARNDQVFAALYKDGGAVHITGFMAKPIGELLNDIKSACVDTGLKNIVLVGDAALMHIEFFTRHLKKSMTINIAPEDKLLADAVSVAQVAADMIKKGKTISSFDLTPDYLRVSQAERLKNYNQ